MRKFLVIDFNDKDIRVTRVQRGRRGLETATVMSSVGGSERFRPPLLDQPLRDAVGRLGASGLPAVICIPRRWALLFPLADQDEPSTILASLPPKFADAFSVLIETKPGQSALAVLSRPQWQMCLDTLRDSDLQPVAAVFSAWGEPSTQDAFVADVFHGRLPWLVPPPDPRWKRMRWTPPLERTLAAAAAVLVVTGALAGTAADGARSRRLAVERDGRRAASAASRAVVSTDALIPIITGLAERMPRNAHLLELVYDAPLRRARLRGRAADYQAVSDLASALTALPGATRCRIEKSASVKIGERAVVEFAIELSFG